MAKHHIATIIYGVFKKGIEQGYTLNDYKVAVRALYQPSFDKNDRFAVVKELDYLVHFEEGLRKAQASLELFEFYKQGQSLDHESLNQLAESFNRAYQAIVYCGFQNQTSFIYERFEHLINASLDILNSIEAFFRRASILESLRRESLHRLSRVDGRQVVKVQNGVHLCPKFIDRIKYGELTPDEALRQVKQAKDQVLEVLESQLRATFWMDKGMLLFNPAITRAGLPEMLRTVKDEMGHEFRKIEQSLKEQYPSWFEDPAINNLSNQLRSATSIK